MCLYSQNAVRDAEREWGLAQCFAGFVAWNWILRALDELSLPSEWVLIFLFPMLVVAAGEWTAGVCMACSTNTVVATSEGTQQRMMKCRPAIFIGSGASWVR